MNRRRLTIGLALSACGPLGATPCAAMRLAPAAKDGESLVYVYCMPNNVQSSLYGLHVSLDGVAVSVLALGGYTWFYAPAGPHVLTFGWGPFVVLGAAEKQAVGLESGGVAFYRIDTIASFSGAGRSEKLVLSQPAMQRALAEMSVFKYQPPEHVDAAWRLSLPAARPPATGN